MVRLRFKKTKCDVAVHLCSCDALSKRIQCHGEFANRRLASAWENAVCSPGRERHATDLVKTLPMAKKMNWPTVWRYKKVCFKRLAEMKMLCWKWHSSVQNSVYNLNGGGMMAWAGDIIMVTGRWKENKVVSQYWSLLHYVKLRFIETAEGKVNLIKESLCGRSLYPHRRTRRHNRCFPGIHCAEILENLR